MLAALLTAAPAAAQTPEPGLLYRVVGVAAADVLNVREQPGAASAVVATLRPNATGIAITGMRQAVGSSAWWEVVHGQGARGTGWVAARFLQPIDGEAAGNFPLVCSGTEPFWSLALGRGRAVYATPDREHPAWTASAWMNAAGLRPGHRFAVRLDAAGAVGWVTIARARACTDNMSDLEYPYDAVAILPDGKVLGGCCARAP